MFKQFCENLTGDAPFISVEINPPHGASISHIIDDIKKYQLHEKVSAFSVTDNALARLKMSAVLSAIKLQHAFDKPVMATMSMRDRNKLSLQSEVLGANDFDIRLILALTGDPAKLSDQPEVKGVLERDSTLLLSIIYRLNNGTDYSGQPLDPAPRPIYPFAVSDATAKNMKHLLKRMVKKLNYGARGIFTQPVFDVESARELIDLFEEARTLSIRESAKEAKLILGQFPIVRARTATFINDKVPGIHVPKAIIDEMNLAAMDGADKEREVGFALSKRIFDEMIDLHGNIHLMTHNRFELCSEIIG